MTASRTRFLSAKSYYIEYTTRLNPAGVICGAVVRIKAEAVGWRTEMV